jgi:hypothetical protein
VKASPHGALKYFTVRFMVKKQKKSTVNVSILAASLVRRCKGTTAGQGYLEVD